MSKKKQIFLYSFKIKKNKKFVKKRIFRSVEDGIFWCFVFQIEVDFYPIIDCLFFRKMYPHELTLEETWAAVKDLGEFKRFSKYGFTTIKYIRCDGSTFPGLN